MKQVTAALVGNPNCGKTTLFNALTGTRQYVGNWPGVTVERKTGKVKSGWFKELENRDSSCLLIDLPGVYSLTPYSVEEQVTQDFLLQQPPDLLVNLIDATALSRSLYLSLQLLDLKIPTVFVLNMMDEIQQNGIDISVPRLSRALGIPVLSISAAKEKGIEALLPYLSGQKQAPVPQPERFYNAETAATLKNISSHIDSPAAFWYAVKALENDMDAQAVAADTVHQLPRVRAALSAQAGADIHTLIASQRYRTMDRIVRQSSVSKSCTRRTVTDCMDRILTNRFLGIPIFLMLMFGVFQLTVGGVGNSLSDAFRGAFDKIVGGGAEFLLAKTNAAPLVRSLVEDGILSGVGGVLSFLPQIALLFFFLSFFEGSGYMARVAFVMDRLMRRVGLNGKAFIPLMLGFGCSVPAVMATKSLETERDRRLTMLLVPFISCSARTPVYLLFLSAFFPHHRGILLFALYVLGLLAALLVGFLLRKSHYRGESMPFLIELPPYRLPTLKNLLLNIWEKVSSFLIKAGTVIFAASVLLWCMQHFDFRLRTAAFPSDSMIGTIGRLIAPLFAPLGFGDWRAAAALLIGISAKEAVVSSMEILYHSSGAALSLTLQHSGFFTPASALSFLVFVLLYLPCIATIVTIRRETASLRHTAFTLLCSFVSAYLFSFLTYRIALFFL